jgi:NAD(P)-dependent dehydrogenase (short-subunit alcohol dehydrogenase family)
MAQPNRFTGHVALVTGAGHGMGAQVSRRLAAEGAAVAALDVDLDAAQGTAEEIRRSGGTAEAGRCDVRSPDDVERAVQATRESIGEPDRLAHCAGIIRINRMLEITEKDWDDTLAVNLKGTFTVLQTVCRGLVESGTPGRIVAISSIAARGPRPDCADYAASKAGVISLVQSAAVAFARHGITVNAVCPGVVDTEMTARIHERRGPYADLTPADSLAHTVEQIPLGRIASPDDVARAIAFLLSDDAGYITGQAVSVCGGLQIGSG